MIDPDTLRPVIDRTLDDLASLLAIESVSADPARAPQLRRSAETIAGWLAEAGCPDVAVVEAGGAPAVIGRCPAPEGMPTVCLYAHHDVQPTGDPALWSSPPFVATRVGDRLYGRGAADDKGGVAVHLAALRAFEGRPPVGVTVFVEGEEEVGSPSLARLLAEHRDALAADLYVIADSGNWAVGQPAFTTTLRGVADCVVELRTLDHGIHSGVYGGVVPDALTALCRLLATLHDKHGNVAVPGLSAAPAPQVDYPEERLRAETGVLPGVQWIGDGSFTERIWCRPAISVLALDTTRIADASNTLLPAARAKLSLRIPPGNDAGAALRALTDHLRAQAPWGAQVAVTDGETGEPADLEVTGGYAEAARTAFRSAWGVEPVLVGQGGSIPMVADFGRAFPEATILVTAVADPDSRIHGPDESLHLGDFARACLAETALLRELATLRTAGRA